MRAREWAYVTGRGGSNEKVVCYLTFILAEKGCNDRVCR